MFLRFNSDNSRSRKHEICDRIRNRARDRRPIADALEVKLEQAEATLADVFTQAVKDFRGDSEIRQQLVAAIRFQIS